MDYKKEAYDFIKAKPGCRSMEIWDALNTIIKDEYNKKTTLGKLWADFPFGLGDKANLVRIFSALEQLEREGLIRHEMVNDNLVIRGGRRGRKFYPTGKRFIKKGSMFNLKLQHA
jgi:hypothetical protein